MDDLDDPLSYEVPKIKASGPPSKPPRRKNKHTKSVEQQLTDRHSWGDPYAVTPVTEAQQQGMSKKDGGMKKKDTLGRPPSRPAPPPPHSPSSSSSLYQRSVSPYAVSSPRANYNGWTSDKYPSI